MKIAISNLAWDHEHDQTVLGLLRMHGILGIEVAPTKLWPQPIDASDADRAAYRIYWAGSQIRIVALQSLLFGQSELRLFDDAARPALFDYLVGIMNLARDLGAGPLVFGSPKNRLRGELSQAAAMDIAVPFFARLAQAAHARNTILCIEPNPPQYGADFITNTTGAVALAAAVNHPGLGINLDLGIMTMNGEDFRAAIDAALPWLRHIHISEPQLAPIQYGVVDHFGISKHLREVGYDRWVSIEMLVKPPTTEKATEAVINQTLTRVQEFYGD